MKEQKYLIAILFIFLVGCEVARLNPGFIGISETDSTGIILRSDSSDWNFQDEWSFLEEGLFNEGYDSTCSVDNYYYKVIAYPNPCSEICYLYINIPMQHRFVYKIVDESYTVLSEGETTRSSVTVNVSEFQKSNEVVRLYYKIINHSCELRGHGDILIQ